MKVKAGFSDKAVAQLLASPGLRSNLKIGGRFQVECYRKGKLVWKEDVHNIWTDEGLNRILDVFFHGTTQTATWYCGLVETDTAPAAGMTYDVPVFTESTSYDEGTRPAYVEAAASGKSTTNSASKAVFTISATKTMYGAALFSIDTKGDHAASANNVLACYAKFSAGRSVLDDDVVNLTYTVTSADDGV
jgi:hypothetical protein